MNAKTPTQKKMLHNKILYKMCRPSCCKGKRL